MRLVLLRQLDGGLDARGIARIVTQMDQDVVDCHGSLSLCLRGLAARLRRRHKTKVSEPRH